jgi:hypothetical protein
MWAKKMCKNVGLEILIKIKIYALKMEVWLLNRMLKKKKKELTLSL